jgi:hypothetical protein
LRAHGNSAATYHDKRMVSEFFTIFKIGSIIFSDNMIRHIVRDGVSEFFTVLTLGLKGVFLQYAEKS